MTGSSSQLPTPESKSVSECTTEKGRKITCNGSADLQVFDAVSKKTKSITLKFPCARIKQVGKEIVLFADEKNENVAIADFENPSLIQHERLKRINLDLVMLINENLLAYVPRFKRDSTGEWHSVESLEMKKLEWMYGDVVKDQKDQPQTMDAFRSEAVVKKLIALAQPQPKREREMSDELSVMTSLLTQHPRNFGQQRWFKQRMENDALQRSQSSKDPHESPKKTM